MANKLCVTRHQSIAHGGSSDLNWNSCRAILKKLLRIKKACFPGYDRIWEKAHPLRFSKVIESVPPNPTFGEEKAGHHICLLVRFASPGPVVPSLAGGDCHACLPISGNRHSAVGAAERLRRSMTY